jgi:lysozyme
MLARIRQMLREVLDGIFSEPAETETGFSQGIESAEEFWTRVDQVILENRKALDGLDDGPKVEGKPMKINKAGKDLLKSLEGLELEAYPDPESPLGRACTASNLRMRSYRKVVGWEKMDGSPWTIGYGDTGPDVVQGAKITQEEAEKRLDKRLDEFEAGVEKLVTVPLTEGQFSALVCLAYNIGLGLGPKGGLGNSTLLRLLNSGDYDGAYKQFDAWTSGGLLQGRRDKEQALWLS